MRRATAVLVVLVALIACPAGAQASGWVFHHPQTIASTGGLTGVACPAANLCVAVDGRGDVLTSESPAGDPSSWVRGTLDASGPALTGIACPSSTLCVAVDGQGNAFVSADPSAGINAWREAAIDPGHALHGIACPTTSLCVAVDDAASVVTSTDPTAGAGAWTRSTIDSEIDFSCAKYSDGPCPPASFVGVACPSSSLCIAADEFGFALTSSTAGATPSSWSSAYVDPATPYAGTATGVACLTTDVCIVVGGYISLTHDPTSTPNGAWREHTTSLSPTWIGCPLTTLCVTDDNLASFDPASGPLSFRSVPVDAHGTPTAISCPTSTQCVAVDDHGHRVLVTPAVRPFAGRPHVSGAARVGARLTASPGRWRGSTPIDYSYRWQRCEPRCVAITDATSSRYRAVARDLGARLRVIVTASNAGGAGRRAASAPTAVVRRRRRP